MIKLNPLNRGGHLILTKVAPLALLAPFSYNMLNDYQPWKIRLSILSLSLCKIRSITQDSSSQSLLLPWGLNLIELFCQIPLLDGTFWLLWNQIIAVRAGQPHLLATTVWCPRVSHQTHRRAQQTGGTIERRGAYYKDMCYHDARGSSREAPPQLL